MLGVLARITALLAAVAVLSACGSTGRPGDAGSPTGSSSAQTPTVRHATVPPSVVAARSCPFVATGVVQDTMGMRLGRVTRLLRDGRTTGCRFYALQHSPLHDREHLPGPDQPAVEVFTERYATEPAAHNGFTLAARLGRNIKPVQLGTKHVGVCYQIDFDPHDRGQDWACGANVDTVRVEVRTVDTTGSFSTIALMKVVVRHV